jgi:xanthine dehydrogenase accessory factor
MSMTHDEFSQVHDLIARSLRAGAHAVVATLVSRDGHSYRDVGAMMAMNDALELAGGVSGGCLEEYIGRQGRALLRDRVSVLMSFDTATEAPDRPRLGCGGRLEVLVESARAGHVAYLDAVLSAMSTSDRVALCCAFNDAGANDGDRAIIADGRAVYGKLPVAAACRMADDVVALREPMLARTADGQVSISYLWPRPRLVVFGAGEDARPLVTIAKAASWHVTVVDRRARLATPARFPLADVVMIEPWDLAIHRLSWNAWTAAVVMTHSVDDDEQILSALLDGPAHESLAAGDGALSQPGYVGLLGPSVRTDRLWTNLPPSARSRVCSPVGLALGDKSPAAVAVAIMAELVAWRRGRTVAAPQAAASF